MARRERLWSESVKDVDARVGSRFSVYPQPPHVSGYERPELIWLATPVGSILPGPVDSYLQVVDPVDLALPPGPPLSPRYHGPRRPPVAPGPDGHFDHLDPGSRAFLAAHAFACTRRVIDIWESYLRRPLVWPFAQQFERLEILPFIDWQNSVFGDGYMALGYSVLETGERTPDALNFDIIAHETGHAIVRTELDRAGVGSGADFFALHEAWADSISFLSFLHFDTGIERLLRRTRGELLVANELNRLAELGVDTQIRIASNSRRLHEATALHHDRARPFIGAVFDTLVQLYHTRLVEFGIAEIEMPDADLRHYRREQLVRAEARISDAYQRAPLLFKSALENARDEVAEALARSWSRMPPRAPRFADAATAFAEALYDRSGHSAAALAEQNFAWRGFYDRTN